MITIDDLTDEGRKIFAELEKLQNLEVHVGFQAGDHTYTTKDGQAVDICTVAAANEFGGSNRPARPFMRQSFENHQEELQSLCDKANAIIANGGTAEQATALVGNGAKGIIKTEIIDGDFAPNSPVTIALKGSSHPLIATSQMLGAVNYVVVERGKD